MFHYSDYPQTIFGLLYTYICTRELWFVSSIFFKLAFDNYFPKNRFLMQSGEGRIFISEYSKVIFLLPFFAGGVTSYHCLFQAIHTKYWGPCVTSVKVCHLQNFTQTVYWLFRSCMSSLPRQFFKSKLKYCFLQSSFPGCLCCSKQLPSLCAPITLCISLIVCPMQYY